MPAPVITNYSEEELRRKFKPFLKNRKRVYISYIIMLLLFLAFGATENSYMILALVAAMLASIRYHFRVNWWQCPYCENQFCVKHFFHWPFTNTCLHCDSPIIK